MEENNEQVQSPAPLEKKSSSSAVKIIGVVVILAIIAFLIWEFGLKGSSTGNDTDGMTVQPTSPPEATSAPLGAATYQDGIYQAIGEYTNPASREEVNVTVTLSDGVITSADFTGTPDNPTTTTMQGRFNAGFEELVVGKSINEVSLTVVNGSSLTPGGFMDALEKIKTQAQG